MIKLTSIAAVLFLLGLTFVFGSISQGQSGRRAAKPLSPAVPTPSPEPTPGPKATPATKPPINVLVGIDGNGGFQNFPSYFYTTALESFIKGLSKEAMLDVIDGGDMTRGEATKKAKAEKEGYVVHLQLGLDSMNPGARSDNARDAIVEYILMEPATTKVEASGRLYARSFQNRGILRPPTSGIYDNYALEAAANAAAQEVAKFLKRYGPAHQN
ncbi:MAG TPA: hypothetical protein VHR36_13105 [Pyrinomonadaceae bacterium]|nr:hypothetical protein [Pyrinomonadaceae bacterium]